MPERCIGSAVCADPQSFQSAHVSALRVKVGPHHQKPGDSLRERGNELDSFLAGKRLENRMDGTIPISVRGAFAQCGNNFGRRGHQFDLRIETFGLKKSQLLR